MTPERVSRYRRLAQAVWPALLFLLLIAVPLPANDAPRISSYSIDVGLHPEEKEIRGHEILTWVNPAGDPTEELQFHCYLNAFKNEESTFLTESGGRHRRETLEKGKWGWIDVDSIAVIDGPDLSPSMEFIHPDDDNEQDQTVMRVLLPAPLAPGDSLRLSIDFRAKLHQVFARSGYRRDFFMGAQWFPKIGVYEGAAKGWNCHQYHAHSEFFSDFGTYDVTITLPGDYVVGATGELVEEIDNPDGTRSHHFHQEDVHDFAWTASPHYVTLEREFIASENISRAEVDSLSKLYLVSPDEIMPGDVTMTLLLQPSHLGQADRHFRAIASAIKYFGLWYGPYPYSTVTVFDPPRGAEDAGGMEYPTLFGAGTSWITAGKKLSPEGVIVHEYGHQYWYGLVASNEFEDPWLDEGFNTYSTEKVLAKAYGDNYRYKRIGGDEGIPCPGLDWLTLDTHREDFGDIPFPLIGIYLEDVPVAPFESQKSGYLGAPAVDRVTENSWSFYNDNGYWVNAYSRPALILRTLENILGEATMARVMRAYYTRFRYRHPTEEQFVSIVGEVSGIDMEHFLRQALDESLILDYSVDLLTSDTLKVKAGFFETPEGRIEVGGDNDEDEEEKMLTESGLPLIESEIDLRRLGGFIQPVDLLVTFDDGEVVRERWDGVERWVKYKYTRSAALRSAEIDPLHQIALDVNMSNNSRTLETDHRPALKWSARWFLWIQNLLHLATAFG